MKKILFVIVITIACFKFVNSQTDTVIVTQEKTDIKDEKYDKIYQLFIQDSKEVNYLWKLDLVDIGKMIFNFGYENKLGKRWSAESYFKIGRIGEANNQLKIHEFNFNSGKGISFTGDFKYYYNYKRRERIGKNTNRLSGNYVSLGLDYSLYDNRGKYSTTIGYDNPVQIGYPQLYRLVESVSINQLFKMNLKYGLQRAIGNIGYFETFIELPIFALTQHEIKIYDYTINEIEIKKSNDVSNIILSPIFGFKIGLAVESIGNLRRKYDLI